MSIRYSILVLLAISAGLITCKKKDTPAPDLGYNYFPGKIGSYITYEIDSFVQDEDLPFDTLYKYQVKEVLQSTFVDNTGRPSIRIERYKKKFNDTIPYSALPWLLSDVWYATKTSTGLEKVEEDVRYLRLIFPVSDDEEDWNGNVFNVFEEWPYNYSSHGVAEIVNGFSFDSVLTIEQINTTNFVETKYGLEKYAAGIGLVYKELRLVGKQPQDGNDLPPYDDTLGLQNLTNYWYYPDKALIFTQRVIDYGL